MRRLRGNSKLNEERVLDRVGFLFSQYREEYLYATQLCLFFSLFDTLSINNDDTFNVFRFYDVVETVRKLYLVTVVCFNMSIQFADTNLDFQ